MSLVPLLRVAALPALLALSACGESLTRPADLPITEYPANRPFTLTLVMSRCRSACETYGESKCDVSIEPEDRTIKVSPQVEIERNDDEGCVERCGGAAVLAHCEVSTLLPAGTWTVEATDGNFSRTITLL